MMTPSEKGFVEKSVLEWNSEIGVSIRIISKHLNMFEEKQKSFGDKLNENLNIMVMPTEDVRKYYNEVLVLLEHTKELIIKLNEAGGDD